MLVTHLSPESDVKKKMKVIFDYIKSKGSLRGKLKPFGDLFEYEFVHKYEKDYLLRYIQVYEDTLWVSFKDMVGVQVFQR